MVIIQRNFWIAGNEWIKLQIYNPNVTPISGDEDNSVEHLKTEINEVLFMYECIDLYKNIIVEPPD